MRKIPAGIHPEHAAKLPADWEKQLEEMLGNEQVCALGEIGLDYHYPEPPRELQREIFERSHIGAVGFKQQPVQRYGFAGGDRFFRY